MGCYCTSRNVLLCACFFACARATCGGSPPSNTWGSLAATHFWDCNGGGCDAATLQIWDPQAYRYAPQYAPLDPANHGGEIYGETMWLTGAASDALTQLLGDDLIGRDNAFPGGCGRCILVRNPSAVNSELTAVVMKKNRCPPWSNGCETPNVHMDIAVPGYDNLAFSTANICGQNGTYISRSDSATCGSWYTSGAASTIQGCSCSAMSGESVADRILKDGCELFSSWGWTTGNPTLEYQVVACPTRFVELIESSFGTAGVIAPNASVYYPTSGGGDDGGGVASSPSSAGSAAGDSLAPGTSVTNAGSVASLHGSHWATVACMLLMLL